jgi:KUP system potassium uptake protein
MVITTLLTYVVMRHKWKWKPYIVVPLICFFLLIDFAFFGANVIKVLDGGWFPIAVGLVLLLLMVTWKQGRSILAKRLMAASTPLDAFLTEMIPHAKARIPGVGVFLTATAKGTPPALLQNFRHNQVLHEKILLVTIQTTDLPYVPDEEHLAIEHIAEGFYRVMVYYGFMESPDIPASLSKCAWKGLPIDPKSTTFFLGRETIIATEHPGMAVWRERIFAFMSRNALRATDYFNIPSDQAIEIGTVIEM